MKIYGLLLPCLMVTACEYQEQQIKEAAERKASNARIACSNGMLTAQLDHSDGAPKEDIAESVSKCRYMSDEAFIDLAKVELVKGLKDPSSVQYKEIYRRFFNVTGKYNAKNSYGAYTGFKSFEVSISTDTGEWVVKRYNY